MRNTIFGEGLHMKQIIFFVMGICCEIAALGQSVVVSVSGNDDGSLGVPYAVSWTQTSGFTNVSVSVRVGTRVNAMGEAFLTTRLGAGASTNDLVSHVAFAFPSDAAEITLFSNLTLTPGTYYLSLGADTVGDWWWASPSTVTTHSDVVLGPTYTFFNPPNPYLPSTDVVTNGPAFDIPMFSVIQVPEPSTVWLTLLGVGAFAFRLRRK